MIEEIGEQKVKVRRTSFAGDAMIKEDITYPVYPKETVECDPGEADSLAGSSWKKDEDIQYMVDHSPEAFWQTDKDLKITFTNTACKKVSGGFQDEDFIGKSLLEFLTPEGIEQMWRINEARLKNEARGIKTDIVFYELQMRRKDGTYFWAGISSSPRRNHNGDVIGYQGIMRDIGAYKQYEAERKRLEDLLTKAEKMATVEKMAGGIAHELNNAMAGILGYSALLLAEDNLDNNILHKHIGKIMDSGVRATALIQDLQVMSGRNGANRKPVNLNELLPVCLKRNEFQKLSERYPDMALHMDLEPSLHYVSGSLPQLDKSIMNLLAMACEQAGPAGSVSIATRTVYLGRPINGYDNLREGEYVALSITDDGKGISDEDASHIFEPFYIRKVMEKGITGLELSVVREVIKDHNGFINVTSKIGYGATFTIYLPVSRLDAQGKHSDGPVLINLTS